MNQRQLQPRYIIEIIVGCIQCVARRNGERLEIAHTPDASVERSHGGVMRRKVTVIGVVIVPLVGEMTTLSPRAAAAVGTSANAMVAKMTRARARSMP